jgi:hypothetical protein
MTPQIRLQKQHLADLQAIGEIGQEGLRKVVAEAAKLPVAPVHPKQLQEVIAKALVGDEAKADMLLRQVLSLHGMLRQLDLSADEVFSGLSSGLRPEESGWSNEEFENWKSASGSFRQLFELPIVRLSAKALDLSYEHSHLLQRARIITDVRPIFDHDATRIEASVISHKLMVRYDDVEGEHVLSLSVDERDVKELIKQCERALRKAQTAKAQLEDKAGVKTLVPGKD